MSAQKSYADNPLDPERVEGFVADVTNGGANLVKLVSDAINEISIRRSMQIGYMLACQDHGLPVPEFSDPGEPLARTLING
jgi:hypothetical protein